MAADIPYVAVWEASSRREAVARYRLARFRCRSRAGGNRRPRCRVCMAALGDASAHAMNLFLKRPDIINGAISMSGVYDLTEYTKGFFDDQVYYNSPAHYLPNLSDDWYLSKIRASHHIHIYSGSGSYEDPEAAKRFAGILYEKGIGYDMDIWGTDITHDWPTWRTMLPYIIDTKF